jgi:hypothetical protein
MRSLTASSVREQAPGIIAHYNGSGVDPLRAARALQPRVCKFWPSPIAANDSGHAQTLAPFLHTCRCLKAKLAPRPSGGIMKFTLVCIFTPSVARPDVNGPRRDSCATARPPPPLRRWRRRPSSPSPTLHRPPRTRRGDSIRAAAARECSHLPPRWPPPLADPLGQIPCCQVRRHKPVASWSPDRRR